MRINIEIETGIKDTLWSIKQTWLEFVCKRKGHIWTKYKKPTGFYAHWFLAECLFMNRGEQTHVCKRCYKGKYKKRKPKTVKFRRYKKLKP